MHSTQLTLFSAFQRGATTLPVAQAMVAIAERRADRARMIYEEEKENYYEESED